MNRPSQALGLCAIALGLFALTQVSREAAPVVNAAPLDQLEGALSHAVPTGSELTEPRGVADPSRHAADRAIVDRSVPEPTRALPAAAQAPWADIVGELRILAEEPKSFHKSALRHIDALEATARRANEAGTPESHVGPSSLALHDTLLTDVVKNTDESPLVRGAVLMAISNALPEFTFRMTLDDWFAVEATPMELLRTGAIAAARRGGASSCSLPISLSELGRLQTLSKADLPGIYPVELHSLVGPYEAAMLEEWLDKPDPRRELFRITDQPSADPSDPLAFGEYFVTAEVLFTLWGHRSLEDPHIEARVLREATLAMAGAESGSVLYFRPASLIVYSLALCNERMFDLASTLGASPDRLLSSMATQMESLAGRGPLGVAVMAKIESLRYETEKRFDLVSALADVGKRMSALTDGEAHLASDACRYLDGVVQDTVVHEMARATALTAIRDSGSWSHIRGSASAALYTDSPDVVAAVAVVTLREAARDQPLLRAEVLEILREAKSKVTKPWLLADLDVFIAELS